MPDSAALALNVEPSISAFAADVRNGLARKGQKKLRAIYLYDELGSALFEAITLLPEYGLTRADRRLIAKHAHDIARLAKPDIVAELGSGTGTKTKLILSELSSPVYYPIDISHAALRQCTIELESVATVHPINAPYLDGIRHVVANRTTERMLVLFLGSSIGNFDASEAHRFLRDLRDSLREGDTLLLGVDLVKPVDRMLLAYDDPAGVTAAFNKNLLARINRELGADFDLRSFEHEARYDPGEKRIEMHLRSTRDQRVEIPGARITCSFLTGETIWTESSHKYDSKDLPELASEAGFTMRGCWTDGEWLLAECLWRI